MKKRSKKAEEFLSQSDEEYAKELANRKKRGYMNPKPEVRDEYLALIDRNTNHTVSKAGKEILINYCIKELMKGATSREIVADFAERFGYAVSTTKNILTKAYEAIIEQTEEERAILKEKNTALLKDLYKRNIEKDDLRECRAIIEVLNKMYGLNEEKPETNQTNIILKFDIPNSGQDTIDINPIDEEDD